MKKLPTLRKKKRAEIWCVWIIDMLESGGLFELHDKLKECKPTQVPTAGWVSNRSLENNTISVNHCLKHTTEDKVKRNPWISNLTLTSVPCTLSNCYVVFEKAYMQSQSLYSISQASPKICALSRSDSLHNKHTTMGTKPVLYHKSSA